MQKWNAVGQIRQYTLDTEVSLEIDYHDVTVLAPLSMENASYNYCMGDLAPNAYVLGSKGDYNGGGPRWATAHCTQSSFPV